MYTDGPASLLSCNGMPVVWWGFYGLGDVSPSTSKHRFIIWRLRVPLSRRWVGVYYWKKLEVRLWRLNYGEQPRIYEQGLGTTFLPAYLW